MNYIKKKLLIKKSSELTALLIIEGTEKTKVSLEWLKGSSDGRIILFATPEIYAEVQNGIADIPARTVTAAAVGSALEIRGQLVPFSWNSALKMLKEEKKSTVLNKNINQSDNTDSISNKEKCPVSFEPAQTGIFSNIYPDSVWTVHSYRSSGKKREYYTGIIYINDNKAKVVTAVPGNPSAAPPAFLAGFNDHIIASDNKWYWLYFEK